MAGLKNWKKKKKKKRLVWNLEDRHPSLFVAQLVLGSNPKVTKFFKEVNLLVPMNLSICLRFFIDFGKQWVSEWGTYFD
jgi:hypothetical protein